MIFVPIASLAQVNVYLNGTVGTYAMGDLKSLMENIETQFYQRFDIPLNRTSNFPLSLQGEAKFEIENEYHTYGGYINYAMTKGRSFYGDYSGETFVDQIVRRVVMGSVGGIKLDNTFCLYGKLGLNMSFMNITSGIALTGIDPETEKLGFNSTGISIEPGFSWTKKHKQFLWQLTLGYEINFQGKSMYNEDSNAYLKNGEEEVKMNWSGIRLGIGMGFGT
jgi:hypothetical protein